MCFKKNPKYNTSKKINVLNTFDVNEINKYIYIKIDKKI